MREKPKYTAPCNRCGLCCSLSLCPAAEIAFPGETAPCRALFFGENGEATCGLVVLEETMGLGDIVRKALGVGCGCSMPDDDTTEDQVAEFDRASTEKMFGAGA